MELKKMNEILAQEPSFRFKQIEKALYVDFIDNWDDITNLPKRIREELAKNCRLEIEAQVFVTKNKTQKAVITLNDGEKIETVLLRHKDGRNTVCVSSQVGCALACEFCATGTMGLRRNLETEEIVEQVLFFSRILKKEKSEKGVTNVVFMGMGEPFMNYDNVIKAIKILNNPSRFNIGARKISISTAGLIDGIKKLAKEDLQVNLAISLHASNDDLRTSLMRVNKKNSLVRLFEAVDYYLEKTSRKVMFEYLLIKDVNDKEAQARELVQLMSKHLYMVNLIAYNPTGKFKASDKKNIAKFKGILESAGVEVSERYSFGQDISAACGQLVVKN
jgi:23S rRNA (adenine2503-C2)-methyltransferase